MNNNMHCKTGFKPMEIESIQANPFGSVKKIALKKNPEFTVK